MTFTGGARDADLIDLRYFRNESNGSLTAKVRFGAKSEGAPGRVHGGAVLTALDEAMGAACWAAGHPVLTVHFNATFRKGTPLDTELLVETVILKVQERMVTVSAVLKDNDGTRYAEAQGRLARLPEAKLKKIFNERI